MTSRVRVRAPNQGGATKTIILYPGIPTEELSATLAAAFGVSTTITGVTDSNGAAHPLSALSDEPSRFSEGVYTLFSGSVASRSAEVAATNAFSFTNSDARALMEIFEQFAPTGILDQRTFERCFAEFIGEMPSDETSRQRAASVMSRLFQIFDRDGNNGVVDTKEFLSGLSVLCQGDRDEKIRSAFDLYDYNGDGFISLDEMTRYLTSVFSVISETSPQVFEQHGVSPEELGEITAEQCFAEADLNHDGRLSFSEFKRWYTEPEQEGFNSLVRANTPADTIVADQLVARTEVPLPSLEEVRAITGLGDVTADDVFAVFEEVIGDGDLDRRTFRRCFRRLARRSGMTLDNHARTTLDRLFDVFDRDGNGTVDYEELGSGLSVLCKGARDEKIRAAFDLYDINRDGFISLDEMTSYLSSVYRVLYRTSPDTASAMGVGPDELGAITAEQCFAEADLNHDGRLSFDEFKRWYSKPAEAPSNDAGTPNWVSLREVRRLTCLERFTSADVFEEFAVAASEHGTLDRSSFYDCFQRIIMSCGSHPDPEDRERAAYIVDRLFDVFDVDGNGEVDFSELASGLSVLCGGESDDKVKAAFALYDYNGDGFISLEEMTRYLASVFRVLFESVPGTAERMGVSPDALAEVTAEQAFVEADLNHDGRLSFDEFQRWYLSNEGVAVSEVAESLPSWVSLAEVRRLTQLERFAAEDVFEAFAMVASDDGTLDRDAFYSVFRNFVSDQSVADRQRTSAVLERLFDVFDQDGNGVVDFSELASGLSVLCGGERDDKAEAAFALFDYDGNGFISYEEMKRYLTCVFKVMYETQPGTAEAMGMSADDLAQVTAEQAFVEADLNDDGQLSFEEFRMWYQADSSQRTVQTVEQAATWVNLPEVRRLTRLEKYAAEDVFEVFAHSASEDGTLSKDAFLSVFRDILSMETSDISGEERDRIKMVVHRLFDVFDLDGNGVVDFCELSSGLSVLCGGERDDKAEAAFALFDYNGDGFISLDEMVRYLTCVFRVVYETSPGTAERMGMGPEQLAEATAQEAFMEADLNHDGRLSFDEFRKWYVADQGQAVSAAATTLSDDSTWMTLPEIRRLTGLGDLDAETVFRHFASAANQESLLSREAFYDVFRYFVSHITEKQDMLRTEFIVDRLFDIFDLDKNGYVDFSELASGLSVLCGGDRDEKVAAAFALYDSNGDGFISLEEMISYLTSVYKVLYNTQPGTADEMEVTPERLAEVTAEQCFIEADLNHDGRLSFAEFKRWYAQEDVSDQGFVPEVGGESDWLNLAEVRRITQLENYAAEDVFEEFAVASNEDGMLDRTAFDNVIARFIAAGDPSITSTDRENAHAVAARLFDVFDSDGNGLVDFAELTSGLSVLCGGERDAKAEAAFALYDYNGDGFISLEEMTRYLTSVFLVMYTTQPGTAEAMGVTAEELAKVTAEQAFVEADLNNDGRLSFEEFQRWYAQTQSGQQVSEVVDSTDLGWLSLEEVRRLTGLENFAAEDVFEEFAILSNEEGTLDRAAFFEVFRQIIAAAGGGSTETDLDRAAFFLGRLFDSFDQDGNGLVDFSELASGLSVLCGGERDAKAEAAFALYDYNGDGFISLDEMTRYLTCVFKVMYEAQPGTEEKMGATPVELANATAEQAFVEADLNNDGRLSFTEFQRWYSQSSDSEQVVRAASNPAPEWLNLAEVRRLTHLENFSAEDIFEEFAIDAMGDGTLDYDTFTSVFSRIIEAAGGRSMDEDDRSKTLFILERLFAIFDTDHNGVVDFSELASGLSVLCGGGRDEKAEAAFALYDYNGDGFISLEEMTRYLTCVFKVMYEAQPGTAEEMGVGAEELAEATAEQAFVEADLNHDGRLSFDEFQRWYVSSEGKNVNEVVENTPSWVSLAEVRRLTHLEHYAAEDVFEEFALVANEEGTLSKESFFEVFQRFISAAELSEDERNRTAHILHRLYDIFDADGNGVVDFSELASGLSVLCGGNRDDKIEAAFALYDYNGDGFISLEEMTTYLNSVFRVLYESQPDVSRRVGVSTDELAAATAEQCFIEADLNHDGRLSFDEFKRWFVSVGGAFGVGDARADEAQRAQAQTPPLAQRSLSALRRLTKLEKYEVNEVIDFFAAYASDESQLDQDTFDDCFEQLIQHDGGHATAEDEDAAREVVHRLFAIFDQDGNGYVDFHELASGLSVLCAGTREDKVRSAFRLFDFNGDGHIDREEMSVYLLSVFKVLYEAQPGMEAHMGVSAEELGMVTADQCFKEADLNADGRLSFQEFKRWYSKPGSIFA